MFPLRWAHACTRLAEGCRRLNRNFGGVLVLLAVRTVLAVEIAIVRWRYRVLKRRVDRRASGAPFLRLLTQIPARTVRAIA